MMHGRTTTKTVLLLIGLGLLLSACAAEPDYGAPGYAYGYPIEGGLDFDYVGGWGGWHHDWAHRDHAHGAGWAHAGARGHGFARHAGLGGRVGFGGHGGGGHGRG